MKISQKKGVRKWLFWVIFSKEKSWNREWRFDKRLVFENISKFTYLGWKFLKCISQRVLTCLLKILGQNVPSYCLSYIMNGSFLNRLTLCYSNFRCLFKKLLVKFWYSGLFLCCIMEKEKGDVLQWPFELPTILARMIWHPN